MMAYDQLTKSWPSLENRVLLRAKTNRMILVEGSDDQEFVRNTINSSNDVLVQVCAGKDNVIKFFSALPPNKESQEVFALVDIDYDWVLESRPDYLDWNRVYTYAARDLESFKFFFQNTEIIADHDRGEEFSFTIQCALILGRIRAWNTWKALGKSFNNSQDAIIEAFQVAHNNLDQDYFRTSMLDHFELGINFYNETLLTHLESIAMNRSFLIRGKDLETFFISINASARFSDISNNHLSGRAAESPLYAKFENANLI